MKTHISTAAVVAVVLCVASTLCTAQPQRSVYNSDLVTSSISGEILDTYVITDDELPDAINLTAAFTSGDSIFASACTPDMCVAGGLNGRLVRLTFNNKGDITATDMTSGTANTLRAMACQGSYCVAAGNNVVIESTDAGLTWAPATGVDTTVVYRSATCWKKNGNKFCAIVGDDSYFARRADDAWEPVVIVDPAGEYTLYGVDTSDGNVITVGLEGWVYTSTDNGQTWDLEQVSASTYFDISCAPGDSRHCVLVGSGGVFANTRNAGNTFSPVTVTGGPTFDLHCVWCGKDAEVCMAGGGLNAGPGNDRGRMVLAYDITSQNTDPTTSVTITGTNQIRSISVRQDQMLEGSTSTPAEAIPIDDSAGPPLSTIAIVILGLIGLGGLITLISICIAKCLQPTSGEKKGDRDSYQEFRTESEKGGGGGGGGAAPAVRYNRGNTVNTPRPPPEKPYSPYGAQSDGGFPARSPSNSVNSRNGSVSAAGGWNSYGGANGGGYGSDSDSGEQKVTVDQFWAEPIAVVQDDGWTIPPIVYACVDWMMARGLDTEGVFRIPGNHTLMKEWLAQFNAGVDVDMNEIYDANDVAGLLKLWTKQQPGFLVPQPLYKDFMRANNMSDDNLDDKIAAVRAVIQAVPGQRAQFLSMVVRLFKAISDNWRVNKMKVNNMAMVYAPTLFKKMSIGNANSILGFWIRHYEQIFC